MFSFYTKADAWIIRRLNDLYLWALDWTGLYVGTVCFLVGTEQTAYLIWRGHAWAAFFLFLILALGVAAPRYFLQAIGDKKMFNDLAEHVESTWALPRHIFIWWNILTIPAYVIDKNYWGAIDSVFGALIWYVFCFRIRDREKKEFKVFKTAMQGSVS